MSSVVPRPIRERKLLFSNFKTKKDLSAVAVETDKVVNIVSSLRMFGKQSALICKRPVTTVSHMAFLLERRRPIAKIQIQSPRRVLSHQDN
jgi:hypothetical protein